jgi:hypothetical protein
VRSTWSRACKRLAAHAKAMLNPRAHFKKYEKTCTVLGIKLG